MKTTALRSVPAPALQIQILLEVVLLILNVLDAIERVLGISFSQD